MELGTEKGVTCCNILTIYLTQSSLWLVFWCKYIVASQQDIGFFVKRSSYVHPQLWVSEKKTA